ATAVVPKPIPGCQHSYIVEPGTPGCVAFATKFGVTFEDLLKWNLKLSPKCDNLDVGEAICVSMTVNGPPLCRENPRGAVVPGKVPGAPPQGNLWDPAPYTRGAATATTTAPTSTGAVPPPAVTDPPVVG
ncbi:hypothetical protein BGZ96_006684, partial [Linnemannia gamsii]